MDNYRAHLILICMLVIGEYVHPKKKCTVMKS